MANMSINYGINYDAMTKTAKDKFLREKFLNANEDTRWRQDVTYTIPQIIALMEMATEDVYPDGRFWDVDCSVWSEFRSYLLKAKQKRGAI